MSKSPGDRSASYSRSRSRSPASYRDGGHEEGNCTVFAGNLNHDSTEQGLREFFSAWGKVVDVKIIYDQETGRSRGFGFIKYEDQRDADDAIDEADGKIFDGRPLKCNPARSGGGGRGSFYPRGGGGFRGGFRGGPPVRGRGGGRFGDFNNWNYGNYGNGGYGGYGNGGYPQNYFPPGRGGYGGGGMPPPQRPTRRRSYSQSPGRYSPGRYSPGSQSRSATPPPKRHRRSHHKDRSHAEEPSSAPRPAPPENAAGGMQQAAAPHSAPQPGTRKRGPPRRGASPSGSSSYTSGSSYSSSDSEASRKRGGPPTIRGALLQLPTAGKETIERLPDAGVKFTSAAAPGAGVPPAPGSFRKELDEAKQRENQQSIRVAALEAKIDQSQSAKLEVQGKLEETQAKLQKSEESCKQYRKWLAALADYSRQLISGREGVRAAEAEYVQREEELGLFLKEADTFLAAQKHRSGRRKRDRHAAATEGPAAVQPESEARIEAGTADMTTNGTQTTTEEDAAAKFKPGIKFKLTS